MLGGLLLMAAALCLTCCNIWEARRAEEASAAALKQLRPERPAAEAEMEELPDYLLDPEMEMPTEEIDGRAYIGTLTIPVLELELPVLSEWSYPGLRVAPGRFEGSAYLDDLIIAAHNYRSHFGGLKSLLPGDTVTFTDVEGNVFHYTVAELETLGRDDLELLEGGQWDLTLFTCTVGGKSRVSVRCVREMEEQSIKRSGSIVRAAPFCASSQLDPVQQPHAQVQVCGEGDPQEIGQLHPGSRGIDPAEGQKHPQNQRPRRQQPEKRQVKAQSAEEEDGPEEVEQQLDPKEPQSSGPLPGDRALVDPGRADAHQGKQNCPEDGEHDAGRRQRRLCGLCKIGLHAVSGQPSGQAAHRLRRKDPEGISFPGVLFHS